MDSSFISACVACSLGALAMVSLVAVAAGADCFETFRAFLGLYLASCPLAMLLRCKAALPRQIKGRL